MYIQLRLPFLSQESVSVTGKLPVPVRVEYRMVMFPVAVLPLLEEDLEAMDQPLSNILTDRLSTAVQRAELQS